MITDLAEVRRLGESKTAENQEFRRYLSAHHRPIEPFHILAQEIQEHIDCKSCANCCRNSVVPVSRPEIDAIARRLDLTPREVIQQYTLPDPDAPATLILRSSKEGCVFLEGNLCAIYEARPKPCRDFPHVAPGTHSLGGRVSSLCRWASLCPIVYNALEAYKHLVGYHPPPGREPGASRP